MKQILSILLALAISISLSEHKKSEDLEKNLSKVTNLLAIAKYNLRSYETMSSWLVDAHSICSHREVPDNFYKACVIYELKRS